MAWMNDEDLFSLPQKTDEDIALETLANEVPDAIVPETTVPVAPETQQLPSLPTTQPRTQAPSPTSAPSQFGSVPPYNEETMGRVYGAMAPMFKPEDRALFERNVYQPKLLEQSRMQRQAQLGQLQNQQLETHALQTKTALGDIQLKQVQDAADPGSDFSTTTRTAYARLIRARLAAVGKRANQDFAAQAGAAADYLEKTPMSSFKAEGVVKAFGPAFEDVLKSGINEAMMAEKKKADERADAELDIKRGHLAEEQKRTKLIGLRGDIGDLRTELGPGQEDAVKKVRSLNAFDNLAADWEEGIKNSTIGEMGRTSTARKVAANAVAGVIGEGKMSKAVAGEPEIQLTETQRAALADMMSQITMAYVDMEHTISGSSRWAQAIKERYDAFQLHPTQEGRVELLAKLAGARRFVQERMKAEGGRVKFNRKGRKYSPEERQELMGVVPDEQGIPSHELSPLQKANQEAAASNGGNDDKTRAQKVLASPNSPPAMIAKAKKILGIP